ncbi:MAG: type VII toxin-antitoxin system HepT family RNase toxin [Iamia sp.]
MTPNKIDADTVLRRLRLIEEALSSLEGLRNVDAARLEAEPLTRAAAERLLQVIVDLAFDVNGHLVVALLGRAPETGRQSFLDLAEAGVLEEEQAARLAPAAGLRNVLVHHYVDVRVDLVADAVSEVLDAFPGYLTAVSRAVRIDADERP